jgi:hypothetical protein
MRGDAVEGLIVAPVRSSVTMVIEPAAAIPITETTDDVYRATEAA